MYELIRYKLIRGCRNHILPAGDNQIQGYPLKNLKGDLLCPLTLSGGFVMII